MLILCAAQNNVAFGWEQMLATYTYTTLENDSDNGCQRHKNALSLMQKNNHETTHSLPSRCLRKGCFVRTSNKNAFPLHTTIEHYNANDCLRRKYDRSLMENKT